MWRGDVVVSSWVRGGLVWERELIREIEECSVIGGVRFVFDEDWGRCCIDDRNFGELLLECSCEVFEFFEWFLRFEILLLFFVWFEWKVFFVLSLFRINCFVKIIGLRIMIFIM